LADLFPAIGLGECLVEGLTLSFEANAAIVKGQAVKLVAVSGDLPKVAAAGTGERAVGVAKRSASQGEQCPVAMSGSVVKVTFGGTVSAGQRVMSGADGVVVAAVPDAPASYSEAGMQTELDKLDNAFARALQSAANGDTGLILIL
jgi:hypothetical protein